MAHTMPTFLVGSDEQRELLDQFQRRCLHLSEAYQKNKPLCFSAKAYQRSHPEKRALGFDDADATLASPMVLGVCDGVSQVDDLGLDAAALPDELLRSCEDVAADQLMWDGSYGIGGGLKSYDGPISFLKEAYADTDSAGSTTVLLAVMDNSSQIHGKLHPMMGVVTLGDCELVMLRRKHGYGSPLEVVLHTEMQRIGGHSQTPLQLCRMSSADLDGAAGFEDDDAMDAIERGSGLHCTSAYEGDVLILGSDGVFDNLFLNEIVAICNEKLRPLTDKDGGFVAAHPARLSDICRSIVERALEKSRTAPGLGLKKDTPVGLGGKADDTSVVVAEVVEWTRERRQAWLREHPRRPKRWTSIFSCGTGPSCCHAEGGSGSGDSDSDDAFAEEAHLRCSVL